MSTFIREIICINKIHVLPFCTEAFDASIDLNPGERGFVVTDRGILARYGATVEGGLLSSGGVITLYLVNHGRKNGIIDAGTRLAFLCACEGEKPKEEGDEAC